jgi:hypothetical protein
MSGELVVIIPSSPPSLENDLVTSPLGFASALERLRELSTPSLLESLAHDRQAESDVVVNSKSLPSLTLTLGMWLALSKRREDNRQAVSLLQDLIDDAVSAALTSDCLFWTAVAKLHLGEFREARMLCERLSLRDPERKSAVELHACIRRRVTTDGMAGLVVVAGMALGVAVLISAFMGGGGPRTARR